MLRAGTRPETIQAAEADLASAQATLKEARSALSETELKAPFAGTVAEIGPVAGEQVVPGAVVVRLADLSAWQIETDDLTELDVVKVKTGAPVSLTFDALPGVQLSGKVVQIKPIGAEKQGDMTYTVVIRPDKHEEPPPLEYDRYDRRSSRRTMQTVEIRVKGCIDEHWSAWLAGLSITHTDQDETILSGQGRRSGCAVRGALHAA